MPYDIRKQGDKWCVYGPSGNHGCHNTRAQAIRQQRALYVRENAAADEGVTVTLVDGEQPLPDFSDELKVAEGTGEEMEAIEVALGEEGVLEVEEERGPAWHGILALEGKPTSDGRLLIAGEIGERELPRPLNVQLTTGGGHDGSVNVGRIDTIEHIPLAEFERREEFGLSDDLPEKTVVVWAEGSFDTSEHADEAQRMLSNGAGISVDLTRERVALFDPETLEEIEDTDDLGLDELLFGDQLQGIAGKIAAATIVTVEAIEEASIRVVGDGVLVASAFGLVVERPLTMVASAGPLKPPGEWFEDPKLSELTPLTITKEGRVYGHLCDWDGCHIGFQGICMAPFRSPSNFAVFNASCGAGIETAEGEIVPCGKIMFSRTGAGHAPTDNPSMGYQDVQRWYDNATKVGAFVRAGSDRFGTWIAGSLRSDLTDLEIQHLRTHPPSGDWRPVKGQSDLIAAFSVPVGGFPIVQRQALVASADGEIAAIITAPLQVSEDQGARRRQRRKIMLTMRLRELLAHEEEHELTRAEMRASVLADEEFNEEGPWLDDFQISAEDRRRWARSGAALPDGSFPITKCRGEGPSAENAIRAQGRTGGSAARVRAHIRKRVASLGCSGDIFDPYR